MTDYFALLDEPRRLWLDPDQLKVKFLALSAEAHPDKMPANRPADRATADHRFASLNAAYHCLRNPKDRLRHWLELELGDLPKDLQEIPADLADLFTEVGRFRRDANAFLAASADIQSPLLRVRAFTEAQEWTDRLRALQAGLSSRQTKLMRELPNLDSEWVASKHDPERGRAVLRKVQNIHGHLSFYLRWSDQLQETVVQLALRCTP